MVSKAHMLDRLRRLLRLRYAIALLALTLTAGCGAIPSIPANAVQYQAPEGTPLGRQAVVENELLKLSVDGASGKFTLTDKRSGYEWRSNAPEEELKGSKLAGDYNGHIASPFVVEYRDYRATGASFKRGNFSSEKTEVKLYERQKGVELVYDLKQSTLQFSVLLTLDGERLSIEVPSNRIRQNKEVAVLRSIQPYPFFGAVLGRSKEGYVLLPSGPGFAMEFYDNNYPYSTGYQETLYGSDRSVYLRGNRPFISVHYPVFGMKQGEHAVLAVVEKGETASKIIASPSGLNTPYNWAAVEYNYLPDDYLSTPYSADAKKRVSASMGSLDRKTVYTFLKGNDADYVGMGKAYRDTLLRTHGAKKQEQPKGTDPFRIAVYHAGTEPGLFGNKTAVVTTFAEARTMLEQLKLAGVDAIELLLVGWNQGGEYPGKLPNRLPPDEKLGSAAELRTLLDYAGSIGATVQLKDDVLEATKLGDGFTPRVDAARNIKGSVMEWKGGVLTPNAATMYMVNAKYAMDRLQEALPQYKALGIGGVTLYTLRGDSLSSDYNYNAPYTREQMMQAHRDMLGAARQSLGKASFGSAFAYLIGASDHLDQFPIRGSFDLFRGETVPFYPIAVHGLASYSGTAVNSFINEREDRLKHMEYGAIPSYLLTWGDSSVLKNSQGRMRLLGNKFEHWGAKVAQEFKRYSEHIGSTTGLFISDHDKLAEGVYRTTYENGLQLLVNYTDRAYRFGSIEIPPYEYVGVRSAGVQTQKREGGAQ